MRVALIADIHGNLVALDAVLAALATEAIDRIVCLGDVAALGPQPRDVLARLREVGCPVVMGNADAWLLDPTASTRPLDNDARRIEAIELWCARQLSETDHAFLRSFHPTVELDLGDDRTLLCCHGSPRSCDEVIAATTPEADLDRMLEGTGAAIVAGGHTHAQLLRRHRDLLIVNPGSVGLPVDRLPPASPIRNPPWAEYAVVDAAGNRLSIDLRREPFDVERLVTIALASAMPHAEWWAVDWRR